MTCSVLEVLAVRDLSLDAVQDDIAVFRIFVNDIASAEFTVLLVIMAVFLAGEILLLRDSVSVGRDRSSPQEGRIFGFDDLNEGEYPDGEYEYREYRE